jgi:methyl-accepting chemotaxis protein
MKLHFKKANLKVKLFGFAGLAIFLVLGIVATAFFFHSHIETSYNKIDLAYLKIAGANRSIEQASQSIEAADEAKTHINKAVKDVMALRLTEKTYLQNFSTSLKSQFKSQAQQVEKKLAVLKDEKLIGNFKNYRDSFMQYVDIHSTHTKLKRKMAEPLEESQKLLSGIIAEMEEKDQERQEAGKTLTADESEMINISRDCQLVLLNLQNIQQQFINSENAFFIAKYKKTVSKDAQVLLDALVKLSSALSNEILVNKSKSIKDSLNTGTGFLEKSQSHIAQERELLSLMNKTGISIIKSTDGLLRQADISVAKAKDKAFEERDRASEARKLAALAKESATVAKKRAAVIISIIVISGILVFLILSFFLFRSMLKPLNRVIDGLINSADQVASGSSQVANSSHQLSEGASQQAASIEQTSASLEEMSAMTKQNADNANQADSLMKEANQIVSSANGSMSDLIVSMEDISKASQDTSNIIKTIDEIAFQTNLLALNAAVEAARAGEAGAGFSVVADEVRNLAMRAAKAASNTAELIEETVNKVKEGGDLVAATNDSFSQVAISSGQVGELVGEISTASIEQAQGISQVNSAVVEMDGVVQQNASSAEESAAASEEMNIQAKRLRGFVHDLIAIVDGNPNSRNHPSHNRFKLIKTKKDKASTDSVGKKVVIDNSKNIDAEQIIPMDDEDDGFTTF